MNRKQLQKLARTRIKEARSLFSENLFSGSYYLAGYSLECALKACIAKKMNKYEIPDKKFINEIYVHDLKQLVRIAGLETERALLEKTNTAFATNWAIAKDWNESSRYSVWSKIQAEELVKSINSRPNGILQWIRQHW